MDYGLLLQFCLFVFSFLWYHSAQIIKIYFCDVCSSVLTSMFECVQSGVNRSCGEVKTEEETI